MTEINVSAEEQSSIDKLPLSMQALALLKQFKKSDSEKDYLKASERWAIVRPKLEAYEKESECADSGAASDRDIAVGVVDDLTKAPIELILSLAQLVISLENDDKEPLWDELRKAYEAAVKLGLDKVSDKVQDKVKEAARRSLESAMTALRESLLKYLQATFKRSRKHYLQIITAGLSILRGLGGAVSTVVKVVAQPTKISPEWCGLLREINGTQGEAFRRIFQSPLGKADRSSSSSVSEGRR